MKFTVELIKNGKAVRRTEAQGSDVEAAKVWGPVKIPLGREPPSGEWIRVTHLASGRTSWFLQEGAAGAWPTFNPKGER